MKKMMIAVVMMLCTSVYAASDYKPRVVGEPYIFSVDNCTVTYITVTVDVPTRIGLDSTHVDRVYLAKCHDTNTTSVNTQNGKTQKTTVNIQQR